MPYIATIKAVTFLIAELYHNPIDIVKKDFSGACPKVVGFELTAWWPSPMDGKHVSHSMQEARLSLCSVGEDTFPT